MLSNFRCPLMIQPPERRRTLESSPVLLDRAEEGVDNSTPAIHPYLQYVNPHLGKLLHSLALDKRFVRGEGSWLYDEHGDKYLDCVAAYGALPFGHNPPEIWAALHQVETSAEPNLTQPSYLDAAGDLARELVALAPGDLRYVTFSNSGAESVEAAIKMCRAATGRQLVVSMTNGFHGKTLGALSVTSNPEYQDGFAAPTNLVVEVPFGDVHAVEEAMAAHGSYAAAIIVEPLQGEAGIIEAPEGYLERLRQLCDEYGAMLVFDEVQTGLGRTGRLFGCTQSQVAPDVMTLAKALGGGLVPIGAVLANDRAYTEHFARKHSSTFAANTVACRAALAGLRLLAQHNHSMVEQVRMRGERLKRRLQQLQACYPHLIEEVRGRGFMLGLQLTTDRGVWPDRLCGVIAEQGQLAPLLAAYLLNVEGIRVAPTLNGKSVIRIEPPLNMTGQECDALMVSLERAMAVFNDGNTGRILSGVLLGTPLETPNPQRALDPMAQSPRANEKRFAFLVHPLTSRSFADFDPTIASLPDQLIVDISNRMADLLDPFVVSRTRIQSTTGETVFGEFIAVSKTAEELRGMKKSEAIACVREALDLAKQRGAELVGLGAFTSVVTSGGRSLSGDGVPLTTGNSYTAVACCESLQLAMRSRKTTWTQSTRTAIVGATGAIGRSMALLIAENTGALTLIGNPRSRPDAVLQRLRNVAADVCRHALQSQPTAGMETTRASSLASHIRNLRCGIDEELDDLVLTATVDKLIASGRIRLTQSIDEAADAQIVVTATSATGAVLKAEHFGPDAIVCDMSRPLNISEDVSAERPDLLVIEGGVIAVPNSPSLGRLGLEHGRAFACMAETMMLALDGHLEDTSLGSNLTPDSLKMLQRLSQRHGFRVAELRSFGKQVKL